MSERSFISIGDTLSDRDKLLIGVLVACVMTVLAWFIFDDMSMQAQLLREQRDTLKVSITEVRAGAPAFLERKQRLEAYEQRLKRNNTSLDKLMERLAKAQGISIEDFKEVRRVLDDGERRGRRAKGKKRARDVLVAYTQNVTIRKVTLKQLADFLQELERQTAPIRVTSLEVHPSTSDRQELRLVKLSVSTYKREKDS